MIPLTQEEEEATWDTPHRNLVDRVARAREALIQSAIRTAGELDEMIARRERRSQWKIPTSPPLSSMTPPTLPGPPLKP